MRLATLLFVIAMFAVAVETYCRTSSNYGPIAYFFLRHAAHTDPTNAVFGDSHVLTKSRIPGFSFYGWAGEQPEEFNTLVNYFYGWSTKPRKIILQADPQWFGEYHTTREKFVTEENLISRVLPFTLTSAHYRKTLMKNLSASVRQLASELLVTRSQAATSELKARAAAAEQKWVDLRPTPDFNWTFLSEDERADLTEQRVIEQNPRSNFETSDSAKQFEDAIAFLLREGAQVCLFRTPVTSLYLQKTRSIPNSRYDLFDRYIQGIANRLKLTYVDFHRIPLDFGDASFLNSDHMTDRGYDTLWPLVARACFER